MLNYIVNYFRNLFDLTWFMYVNKVFRQLKTQLITYFPCIVLKSKRRRIRS